MHKKCESNTQGYSSIVHCGGDLDATPPSYQRRDYFLLVRYSHSLIARKLRLRKCGISRDRDRNIH